MSKLTKSTSELPKYVSGKTLALLWGVSDRMVRELAQRGIAVRAGQGKYDLEQSCRNYAESLRKAAAGRQQSETLTPQLRLKLAQAMLAELDLAERQGKLESREDNERKAINLVTDARKMLLAVPTRVGHRMALDRHGLQVIEEEITQALTALSKGPFPKEETTND
jgi:phage terminase Nu1 subunit (DNA packaging protein)